MPEQGMLLKASLLRMARHLNLALSRLQRVVRRVHQRLIRKGQQRATQARTRTNRPTSRNKELRAVLQVARNLHLMELEVKVVVPLPRNPNPHLVTLAQNPAVPLHLNQNHRLVEVARNPEVLRTPNQNQLVLKALLRRALDLAQVHRHQSLPPNPRLQSLLLNQLHLQPSQQLLPRRVGNAKEIS